MANGKKPKKKPKPVAVCTPPLQRADFLATDCKSALLFPDSAPLLKEAQTHKCVVQNGKNYTRLDLQATWAYVRSQAKSDKMGLLVYFHGHYGYVTIDADGKTATPDWASTPFSLPGGLCAPLGYKINTSADAYAGSIVALVPEIATPNGFPATNATEQAGALDGKDAGALGKLLDECLKRLSQVKNSSCPAPLKDARTASSMTRFFLSGHSGAHKALYPSAMSTIIQSVPTDLILLDCFYGDGRTQVTDFAKKAKGGIGLGAGQSRIIVIWNRGSYSDMKDKDKNPIPDVYSEPMSAMLKSTFKEKFHRVEGGVAETREALKKYPVVAVRTSVGHFAIPPEFIPEVLKSAPA